MGGVYRTSFIARARRINDSAREREREKGGNCEKVTKVRFYRSHGWLVLRMQERTLQVNKFRGFPRDRAVAVCAVPRCRQHPKQSARLASFTTTSRFLLKHTASISRYVANISSPLGNEGASRICSMMVEYDGLCLSWMHYLETLRREKLGGSDIFSIRREIRSYISYVFLLIIL